MNTKQKNEFLTTQKDIEAWLIAHKVIHYQLKKCETYGFRVNVDSTVWLNAKNLSFIPVKFNIVKAGFFCSNNQLTSLEFAPEKVEGEFDCSNNRLTSLLGCPKKSHYFSCAKNQLTSLEFCPSSVSSFHCEDNFIENLEFFPKCVFEQCDMKNNPGLGQLQNVSDFESLYQAHLIARKAIEDKNLLNNLIQLGPQSRIESQQNRSKL